jgi:hypothetical protein
MTNARSGSIDLSQSASSSTFASPSEPGHPGFDIAGSAVSSSSFFFRQAMARAIFIASRSN